MSLLAGFGREPGAAGRSRALERSGRVSSARPASGSTDLRIGEVVPAAQHVVAEDPQGPVRFLEHGAVRGVVERVEALEGCRQLSHVRPGELVGNRVVVSPVEEVRGKTQRGDPLREIRRQHLVPQCRTREDLPSPQVHLLARCVLGRSQRREEQSGDHRSHVPGRAHPEPMHHTVAHRIVGARQPGSWPRCRATPRAFAPSWSSPSLGTAEARTRRRAPPTRSDA